jgi:thymidylate synthase (methanogen type)
MFDIYDKNGIGYLLYCYTPADAHIKALDLIKECGQEVTVIAGERPVKTKEVLFLNLLIMNPLDKTIPERNEWTSDVAIENYANKYIIGKVIPEGFTYSYGNELQEPIDQVARVIEMLKEDHSTRKATMRIGSPQRLFEQDPPCCVIVDTKERKSKLNMFLVFRSHDYGSALYSNLRAFAMLQKKIADGVGVAVGKLGCTSFSAHVYEYDWWKLG